MYSSWFVMVTDSEDVAAQLEPMRGAAAFAESSVD